jgi:magnesium chelatase family protein
VLARLTTTALVGLAAHRVAVEVDVGRGLPAITIVGLGDTAVLQARDRVRAAFGNAGFDWPDRRVTVSLPPSDLPKQGAGFDLPIAMGLLAAAGQVPPASLDGVWALGELGLAGDLRPVRGVLSAALAAKAGGARCLVVPEGNLAEAALVAGLRALGAASLGEVGAWLRGQRDLARPGPAAAAARPAVADLADVRGQVLARRALEVAAAGGHNLLMVGPPGAGKTMLARRLPGLLPPLEEAEALEVTQVWSAAGLLARDGPPLLSARPFRAPHHSISVAGLVGGGARVPRPGEVSLATHGVLFLDELPEFPRAAIEALRQPLEDGEVTVVRSGAAVRLPAAFALVAAANPCPCGWSGDATRACRCGPSDLERYARRLSGPLLDRLDLSVGVERVPPAELDATAPGETSALIMARVAAARERQRERGLGLNARLPSGQVRLACEPDRAARRTLVVAAERLALTARAYHRTLRVARTLADLDASQRVGDDHVREALAFRQLPLAPADAQAPSLPTP